ncbi:hypothetical protein [Desulfosarcina ovata]|uniref:Uncharacterized protein n=1 Tax=Desulfosarcina ovata subsp. ovata TaxID=2752305 RepID=A0A5K8AIF6_9BACT|nr:hypothetical protein [Desulfosarcina ovata]BBO92475.1 hypothetical protein DSCOOX_56550 [Desulfosarcina ovata subsp. ovata]
MQMSISGMDAFAAVGVALKLAEAIGYTSVPTVCIGLGPAAMVVIWHHDGIFVVHIQQML